MASTFLSGVRDSFLAQLPQKADCVAHGTISVTIGKKLLTALVEVGLREAFSASFQLRQLRLNSLTTSRNRTLEFDADVDAGKMGAVWRLRLAGIIVLEERIDNGLGLRICSLTAVGRNGLLDSIGATAAHLFALDEVVGTVKTIESIRLRGARIHSLLVSGDDPFLIHIEIRDAVATKTAFDVE